MAAARGVPLLLLLLGMLTDTSRSSQDIETNLREASTMNEEKICNSIDVRNSVRHLRKLENCTVVEGYIRILLIDKAKTSDFQNISFPKLREIMGYLVLYRVQGLTTLSKLFPNLAVIRGTILFYNYAFVMYEMRDLHDIGLGSLTDIVRGSVLIQKNPRLCFVDTVDWDRIAKAGGGGHFIRENKPWDQCHNECPNDMNCPVRMLSSGRQLRLCWNSLLCQKVCSPECEHLNRTCSSTNRCCSAECLGGCSDTSSTQCVSCRHVIYKGKCLKKCPTGTFEYQGRRCVYEDECKAIVRQDPDQSYIYFKPFNKQCLPHCPSGYTESEQDRHTCHKCKDHCPKVCAGVVVDSVATAQRLKSCTVINGSLEIQVKGGDNVIQELESSLSSIQEIIGHLKIARSFPLISLNFLKDLRVIHGLELDKKEYALLVLDNQNLQELWDWENRKARLRIERGKIFFHFNPKLCPSKIDDLKKYADVMTWDERDVSRSSNGDRVACNVVSLNLTIWGLKSNVVGLRWPNFIKTHRDFDFRALLGYVLYYREAPHKNVTIFDGRDACGSDVWKVNDIDKVEDDANEQLLLLPHLKPFTTYAAYVRTYTIASAMYGAQSSIIYFTTKPYTSTPPVNVQAYSKSHSEIVISWKPPLKPNGNITHYIIDGLYETDSVEFVSQRNYCIEPLTLPDLKKPHTDDGSVINDHMFFNYSSQSGSKNSADCCSCSKDKNLKVEEEDTEFQIIFENFIQNSIYIKNPNANRKLKPESKNLSAVPTQPSNELSTNESFTEALTEISSEQPNVVHSNDSFETNSTIPTDTNENHGRFHHIVYDTTLLVVKELHHFTEYTIEVRACQDPADLDPEANECSTQAITTVRTSPLGGADDIDGRTLIINCENLTMGTVLIKWDQPEDPNGLIVSYHIEYKPADSYNYKPIPVCITQSEYEKKMGYILNDLMPGNYSLRLRATSLAGNGNWTQPVYFLIPDVNGGMKHEVLAIVIIVTCIALCLVVGFPVYFIYKKRYGPRVPDGILYASVNPEYMSAGLVYEPDEWEVSRENIAILGELGQGSFGMVYRGEAKDIDDTKTTIKCAIKTVNDSASMREKIEFLQEASVMKAFKCHHVVKLLGVVSKGHPTLVIMELMAKGDLKAYLRSHRPENENPYFHPPTLKQILQMAVEIADGMAYLAAKKFVHRDLAARNCMVAEDMTVKIGDFGMTRDIYETDYYRKGGKGLLPVRWMAPECLKDGIFSSQSDVWSYGVVLWEMATLASQPYQGLSNEQVLKYVISGGIMDKPENCPEKLYALMKLCWEHNPKARPTFTELIEILLPDIDHVKFQEVSFYFTQRPELCNKENEELADAATPASPLRTQWDESSFGSRDNSDDESEVQYFPSATNKASGNQFHQNLQDYPSKCFIENPENQGATGGEENKLFSIHSNEGSKGMSITSSDGSKGSKVSNVSNGSIVNGHVTFPSGRTTIC